MIDVTDRHPRTQQLARWFDPGHLAPHLQWPAQECEQQAGTAISHLPDGPELWSGLRALLTAKDWFVRSLVTHYDGTAAHYDPRYVDQAVEPEPVEPALTGVGSWPPPHGVDQPLAGDGHYPDPAPMAAGHVEAPALCDPDPTVIPGPQHMASPYPPAGHDPAGYPPAGHDPAGDGLPWLVEPGHR